METNTKLTDLIGKTKNNSINLGTANGWGKETEELYNELSKIRIPDSGFSRNLGRCYNEYGFDVIINEQKYTVKYSVDSSD